MTQKRTIITASQPMGRKYYAQVQNKMMVSTAYELRQVCMKPTPPISLWVSTPTTCTMPQENTNWNMKLCATKRGQGLNCGWLKIVIITIWVSNHKPFTWTSCSWSVVTTSQHFGIQSLWVMSMFKNPRRCLARAVLIPRSACGRHNYGNDWGCLISPRLRYASWTPLLKCFYGSPSKDHHIMLNNELSTRQTWHYSRK